MIDARQFGSGVRSISITAAEDVGPGAPHVTRLIDNPWRFFLQGDKALPAGFHDLVAAHVHDHPSLPSGSVSFLELSRAILRENAEPWSNHTPPPARVPPAPMNDHVIESPADTARRRAAWLDAYLYLATWSGRSSSWIANGQVYLPECGIPQRVQDRPRQGNLSLQGQHVQERMEH